MTRPAIHPGVHIANGLEELGMPAAELARALDIPANRLTEIIRGRRGTRPTPPCGWPAGGGHRPSSG
jgi:plasmid maintenance system antidote protein VapI